MNTALPLTHSGFVIGWRGWFQDDRLFFRLGHKKAPIGALSSLCMDYAWPALEPARCDGYNFPCSNEGIYAFKTFSLMQRLLERSRRHDWCYSVVGSVALWGTIVEHESGFRASHAYPLAVAQAPLRHGNVRKAKNLVLAAALYGFEECDYEDLQAVTFRIAKEIEA